MPLRTRYRALPAVLGCLLAVTACTVQRADWHGPEPANARGREQASTVLPAERTTLVAGKTAAQLAVATARVLYARAPAAVLVGEGDAGSLPAAGSTAVRLGVPLLVTPRAAGSTEVQAELGRLAVRTLVPVGASATRWARAHSTPTGQASVTVAPAELGGAALPGLTPPPPLKDLVVLALDRPAGRAATATARASGAQVLLTPFADPRADRRVIALLAGRPAAHVLALGTAFGPAGRLRARIAVASTGVQLPGGGQVLFPGRRMVALYGHPGDPLLGSLGEQPLDAAIDRVRRVASGYQPLVKDRVVPAFEIIATVASGSAGPDGDYSSESPVEQLRPWVDAARRAGIYVVLDLQPGRTDFLTQARRYGELLQQPHVGLALDPEWRLKPGQRHMAQIGSVSAAEINDTVDWLAAFTREHRLPQKVLMLHQFTLDMITNRATVRTDHDELQVIVHADGFGTAGQKLNTWNTLHINPPPNIRWGWKNFYDEDHPTFTPRQTVAVTPSPVFVSYQ